MTAKNILFVFPEALAAKGLEDSFSSGDWKSHFFSDRAAAERALAKSHFDAMIVANGDFENDLAFHRRALAIQPDIPVVWILQNRLERLQVDLDMLPVHKGVNFISMKNKFFEKEIRITLEKLKNDDIFGMAPYLNGASSNAEIQRFVIQNSGVKRLAIHYVLAYLAQLKINPRFSVKIEEICDELLTNAIFDAPIEPDGERRFIHLGRNTPVKLQANEAALLSFCNREDFFYVSVTDPFGSLDPKVVFSYLNRCFQTRGFQRNVDGKAGGGLGLFKIYNAANSLIFNIHPGVQTEVIAIVHMESSFREWKNFDPSLHVFVKD